MEANLYGFGILTLFMLGVFALLLIIIWVFSREGDSERMKVFEVSQEKNFGVIANALKETVSPLAQRVEEAYEKVEAGLVITKTGFEKASEALTIVINNQHEQKEAQAKEIGIDMDTQNLLKEVAKEINSLQGKVAVLETTSTQQFSELKSSVTALREDVNAIVEIVKKLEKAKSE